MDIPLVSVGFDGYPLEETLDGLAKTGSKNVCLCALDGFTQHVSPENNATEDWRVIKLLFKKFNLNLYGLEGHSNISNPDNLWKIRKRMEFTRYMGGRYIDLSAGPECEEKSFYKNITTLIDYARELNILICLETHGDIIKSGRIGRNIINRINSEWVWLCYDPANVYFYSRGEIDPVNDIIEAIDCVKLLHFKGIHHNREKTEWTFPFMKNSSFSYNKLFNFLKNYHYNGMIAIEIEKMFKFIEGIGFIKDRQWTIEEIVKSYCSEINYLESMLTNLHKKET